MRAAPGVPAATPRCPFSGDTPASGLLTLLAEKACPPLPCLQPVRLGWGWWGATWGSGSPGSFPEFLSTQMTSSRHAFLPSPWSLCINLGLSGSEQTSHFRPFPEPEAQVTS